MLSHLYVIVSRRATAFPAAIALGGEQGLGWRTLTSRDLLELVDRLAAELAARGVAEGDRVVLWLPGGWRTPLYFFALWKLGAVAVPFDREMNPEAASRILASVAPRLLIAGYGERPAWARDQAVTEWWEPGSHQPTAPVEPWRQPAEELAAVVFTSGTTGTPKGCMLTHANLCSQLPALAERLPLDPGCRLASILPLSHLFELTCGLLYPLSQGAAIHYIPSRRGPDIVRVLREQRITHMLAVPQLLGLMARALDDQLHAALPGPLEGALRRAAPRLPLAARRRLYWLAHRKLGGQLRILVSGGAALPAETQALWERFGVRVVQGYGASECSPVIAAGALDGSTPLGSVGKPVRDVLVRLSADGELLVKGPNVMRGYWQDPVRTAEVLVDGWYATGDLAVIDPGGNIRLSGRAKELIVLPSGMNVWPQDVEDTLRAQPGVADAAVVATTTPTGGAILHAFLLGSGSRDDSAALGSIVARANGQLAQHQRLASASWWPDADFPRTALGKVRRALLPTPEEAQSVQIESSQAGDDPVAQAIAGVARVPSVRDDQALASLGLDSMGLVELAVALEEKTGKAVADGDLALEMTVAAVRALVAQAPVGEEQAEQAPELPLWPYRWGRAFRRLAWPIDLLYRCCVTKTVVLGGEHLTSLPPRLILAGTHHSFADVPLLRQGLARTTARRLVRRLVIATGAQIFGQAGVGAKLGVLLLGLYPLEQYGQRERSLRRLKQVAEAGNAVLIFPQGHHIDPAAEQAGDPEADFRQGAALLASALEAAVLPFGLAGTEQLMPPRLEEFQGLVIAKIPIAIRRGPLAVAFGPPLVPRPGEGPREFTSRLQAACFGLARQAQAALPDRRR